MRLLHKRRPPSGDGALVTRPETAGVPGEGAEPPGDAASKGRSRRTIGIRRLVLIGLLAAIGFGLALVRFRDPSDRNCSMTPRSDTRYGLELQGPYPGEHDHPTYRLVTTKRGEPIDQALVCLVSFPGGVVVVVDDVRRSHIHIERVPLHDDVAGSNAP